MTHRERIEHMLRFEPVDVPALELYYAPVGYYEHGEKLNELYSTLPGDFSPYRRMPIPVLPPEVFDEKGEYHEWKQDEWGTTWEYRIYGIWGHPAVRPLDDLGRLSEYAFPPVENGEQELAALRASVAEQKANDSYVKLGGGSLLEKLVSLRRYEDVLCDILTDDPQIHELADRLTDYNLALVDRAIAAGADAVAFGDDYGTNDRLILAPECWRAFIKPRLARMIGRAKDHGLRVFFHCCGKIDAIFEDFAELGIDTLWPQMPLYDMDWLCARLRDLGIACQLHPDRADTMVAGSPRDVAALIERIHAAFRPQNGGSWYYIEADNGFPYENLEALVRAIGKYR